MNGKIIQKFRGISLLLQRVTSQKKVVACPIRKAMVQDKQQLTKFEMITSILFVLCYEVNLTKFSCLKRGCIYNNLPYLEI